MLDMGHWITIGVTLISFIGFVWAIKADTKVLKTQVTAMQDVMTGQTNEIKELQKVLITLADHSGRMNVMDERMMAQGRRFDELQKDLKELLRKDAA
jgi:hypothetical protein